MTGHATSAASPTCSRVWVGVHKIQTRSRRHICLVSSTKLRCFCVSSLSLVTFICVRLNLANINSGHLYMVGGCLQNITSLLLSCCVSERQDRMSRSSSQKGSRSSRVPPPPLKQKNTEDLPSPRGLLSLCCSLLPGIQWGRVEPNSQAAPHTSNVQQIPRIVSYLAVFFFNFYAWDILYGCFLFQSRAELECCEELDSQMDNGRVLVDAHM